MQRPLLIAFSLLAFLFAGCGEDAEKGGGPPESGNTNQCYWEGTFAESGATFLEGLDGNVTVLRFRDGMEAFSGTLTSHGSEGEQRVFRYKEGKQHGLCVMRDKSGGRTEANYRDGVVHGTFVIFGRDGTERWRWRYENGKKLKE